MPPAPGPRQLPSPDGWDGVNVWLFPLDLAADEHAALARLLDAEERRRAAAYRYPLHRDRFIARRGWLRQVMADATGIAPDALRFATGAYGKPRLADGGDVRFSASSAGALGLCVVARRCELGCDIVERDAAPSDLAVAERLFHPSEHRAILAVPPEERKAAFLDCWARKEAYVKALGIGLSHPLDSFAVSVGPEARPALHGGIAGCALRSLAIGPRHHAAVAIRPWEADTLNPTRASQY